jgi:hypothetical protein
LIFSLSPFVCFRASFRRSFVYHFSIQFPSPNRPPLFVPSPNRSSFPVAFTFSESSAILTLFLYLFHLFDSTPLLSHFPPAVLLLIRYIFYLFFLASPTEHTNLPFVRLLLRTSGAALFARVSMPTEYLLVYSSVSRSKSTHFAFVRIRLTCHTFSLSLFAVTLVGT